MHLPILSFTRLRSLNGQDQDSVLANGVTEHQPVTSTAWADVSILPVHLRVTSGGLSRDCHREAHSLVGHPWSCHLWGRGFPSQPVFRSFTTAPLLLNRWQQTIALPTSNLSPCGFRTLMGCCILPVARVCQLVEATQIGTIWPA